MKRKSSVIIVIVAVCAVIMIVYGYHRYFSPVPNATVNQVWVQTAKVVPTSKPIDIKALGTLSARSVEITPMVAGHIKKIFFQDGDLIKAEQPLIDLEDGIYTAKYTSARAQLLYSQNDLQRKSQLGKRGAIAQQAIDQAEAEFKEKKSMMEENKVMLDMMHLTAPFAGVLGKCKVNVGEYVNVGQSLVTLTDKQHLRVDYHVSEEYLPLLKMGQEVKITTFAYPDKVFTGRVKFISPTVSLENRSVALYAEVENTDNVLAPGMFVNVNHQLGIEKSVFYIPAKSLVPKLDGVQIYKVTEGKALAIDVVIGKRLQEMVEVKQGIKEGDEIITDGQIKLRSGMPVQISNHAPIKEKV